MGRLAAADVEEHVGVGAEHLLQTARHHLDTAVSDLRAAQ